MSEEYDHSSCIDRPDNDSSYGECEGFVRIYVTRSGASEYPRCEKHYGLYNQRMDKLEAEIQSRYPGYNVPGSVPPPWFDPFYAGESWEYE